MTLNGNAGKSVVIYSLFAQKVYGDFVKGKKQINTSNWQEGIYFIGIEGGKIRKLRTPDLIFKCQRVTKFVS